MIAIESKVLPVGASAISSENALLSFKLKIFFLSFYFFQHIILCLGSFYQFLVLFLCSSLCMRPTVLCYLCGTPWKRNLRHATSTQGSCSLSVGKTVFGCYFVLASVYRSQMVQIVSWILQYCFLHIHHTD